MKIPDGYYEASPGVLERRKKYDSIIRCCVPDPVPECDQTPALDAAVQGEAKSIPRTRVSFTLRRVKLLDPDNAAGSVKDLLDGLRHAGIIRGDEWHNITLQVDQKKVDHYSEEKTSVVITPQ